MVFVQSTLLSCWCCASLLLLRAALRLCVSARLCAQGRTKHNKRRVTPEEEREKRKKKVMASSPIFFRVLGLPPIIKEYHLINYFSKYGQVLNVYIVCISSPLQLLPHYNHPGTPNVYFHYLSTSPSHHLSNYCSKHVQIDCKVFSPAPSLYPTLPSKAITIIYIDICISFTAIPFFLILLIFLFYKFFSILLFSIVPIFMHAFIPKIWFHVFIQSISTHFFSSPNNTTHLQMRVSFFLVHFLCSQNLFLFALVYFSFFC